VSAEKKVVEHPIEKVQLPLHQNPLALLFLLTTTFYLVALGISMLLQDYNPITQWWAPSQAILSYMGANTFSDTWQAQEFWRLLLYPFVHANLIHVFFMLILSGYVGSLSLLNLDLNRRHFWLTFFLSALAGGGLSFLIQSGFDLGNHSIGLSPVLFGFLGLNYLRSRLQFDFLLAKRFTHLLLIAHAISVILDVAGWVSVDHAAHFGAMAAGMLSGWYFEKQMKHRLFKLGEQAFLFACTVGFLFGCYEVAQNLFPLFASP
jgi:membrane associated rhomboid family serine protease